MIFRDDMGVELIDFAASDAMVAKAAWVSHDTDLERDPNDEKRTDGLINFLWREKHTSPFEHGHATFCVNVPLFVRSEWQRHRTQSFNEISGRYSELKPEFYVPAPNRALLQEGKPGDYHFVAGSPEQYAKVTQYQRKATEFAWNAYQEQLDAGVAKEVARNILPLNTYTRFYATANPLNWLKFLSLRNESHALYEIRVAAKQIEEIFAQQMPLTYKAYKDNK